MIRTPAAKPLTGFVLSETMTGCKTHFVGNRTIPCEAPECEHCHNGIAWRWHGYLIVKLAPTNEIAIFEMTARAAMAFTDYYERHKTLRGAQFKATRVNARSNGRVLIQARPADLNGIKLPDVPPVEKLLCHIWNIAPNQVTRKDHMPRPPAKELEIDRGKPEETIRLSDWQQRRDAQLKAAKANGAQPKALAR